MLLRKRDELQFPKIFAHIHYRRQQGVLIFLSCRTEDVERFLIKKLKEEFSDQFPIEEISFVDADYVPLQFICRSADFSPSTLYIVCKFPFEDYYKNPQAMDQKLERLTIALNIGREYFTFKNLKCVFICPPEVEDRIQLNAPDFYLFTHHSVLFTDDQKFHRDIANLERGGQDEKKKIDFLKRVLKITEKNEQKADIYRELGEVYYNLSNANNAMLYWQKAEVIYWESGNEKKYTSVHGSIGLVYRSLGQLEEASKYFKEALTTARKIGYWQGEADQLGNIGMVYSDLEQPEEALKYLNEALEIYRKIRYLQREVSILGNIGVVYRSLGQFEEALKCLKKALVIYLKIGNRQGEANQLGSIGMVYSDLEQPEDALKYLTDSERIFQLLNFPIPKYIQNALSSLK